LLASLFSVIVLGMRICRQQQEIMRCKVVQVECACSTPLDAILQVLRDCGGTAVGTARDIANGVERHGLGLRPPFVATTSFTQI
jgi:hypothetical protein